MKHIAIIATVILTATTFGCKDAAPPKPEGRVLSASEAMRNDNLAIAERLAQQKAAVDAEFEKGRARELRQRNANNLKGVSKRWESALNEAARTGRSDIAAQITNLQAVMKEATAIEIDDCTGAARATLLSSMATTIEAFGMFQKETGESGEATKKKAATAGVQLQAAETEIEACLNKSQ
ncbi:MAG: hypothetical protein ABI583_04700 [Betaproteobacteria bacterium]